MAISSEQTLFILADVAKESFLKIRTARETLGASKSSKLTYFVQDIYCIGWYTK